MIVTTAASMLSFCVCVYNSGVLTVRTTHSVKFGNVYYPSRLAVSLYIALQIYMINTF